jgi:xylulose-5-phosphate/fructose-6-phosphate phosphoketolase
MRKFFKQFSFPGHIGSHVTPETRARSTRAASWATACRTPTAWRSTTRILIVGLRRRRRRGGDRPLATAWHSNKFLNPSRDGAVLPILNLNGYKIANPRSSRASATRELEALFVGYGYTPYFVEGAIPRRCTRHGATLDGPSARSARSSRRARRTTRSAALADDRAALAQGLDRTEGRIKGHKVEGFWRSHQVPFSDVRDNPPTSAARGLDAQLRPRSCSTRTARCAGDQRSRRAATAA